MLNEVDAKEVDKKVNKLFKEINGLNIEETWKEQKIFVLLKQIYMAATARGNDSSYGPGIWSRIINSISEIDSELMKKYDHNT